MSWRSEVGRALAAGSVAVVLAAAGPSLAAAAESRPAPDGALTLADCVREALEANPDLAAGRARASGAGHAVRVARGARLPQVDGWSFYLASRREQRLIQPSFAGEAIRYETDLAETVVEARVPLFHGGRLAARQRAAEAAAAGSDSSLAALRQDLVLAVAATYLEALERRSVIEATDATLRALEAQAAVAGAMEEVGRIPALDRLKVDVRVAALRQRLSQAVRDERLVRLHLGTLLGRGPESSPLGLADVPTPLSPAPGITVSSAEAVAVRPDVAALEHEAQRRRDEVAAATGERWPAIDAAARYALRSVVGSGSESPLDRNVGYASAAVTVRVALFTGGQTGARVAQARAVLDEAQSRLQAARLRSAEELGRETASLEEARERERVAGAAVGQAEQAYEVETANYEAGRGTVNDVLDAQAALFDARLAHAGSRFDVQLGTVSLARAAGRDLAELLLASKESEP